MAILKYAMILKSNDEALKALLMAESARTGLAVGFCLACENGHLDIVNAILDSALKLQDKGETLKVLLMSKGSNASECGFNVACRNGHLDIVNAIMDSALKFQDKGETLKTLLIGADSKSPSIAGFYLACGFGHFDIVNAIMDAALKFQDKGETLKTLLTAEMVDSGRSGFWMACRNGHLQAVKAILDLISKLEDSVETFEAVVINGASSFYRLRAASDFAHFDIFKTILQQGIQTYGGLDYNLIGLVNIYNFDSREDRGIKYKAVFKEVALQLLALDIKKQKRALRSLEPQLCWDGREILLRELRNIYQEQPLNPNQVKSIYGHHAGLFSLTRWKINFGYIKKDKLIDTLFKRAESHLNGASMLTLLAAAPSPLVRR